MPLNIKGGLVKEKIKAKDFAFHKIKKHLRGKSEKVLGVGQIQHLGRMEEAKNNGIFVPPIFQGSLNACVCCSVCEAMQYLHFKNTGEKIELDWEELFNRVPKYEGGTKPSEVLEVARKEGVKEVGTEKIHKLDAWSRIINPTPHKILDPTLLGAIVIIGVDTNKAQLTAGAYAHQVCHLDFTILADQYQIINHWQQDEQQFNDIPIDVPLINAIAIHDKPDVPKEQVRIGSISLFANYFKR